MRYAIFSDLHDNQHGLHAVLTDATLWQVDRFLCLGDVGRNPDLFQALQEQQIACTFGNWEVSSWQRLPASLAAWVGAWPATITHGAAIFAHATPDMPPTITHTAVATAYMASGQSWHSLFPRLHRQDDARWAALAALEAADLRLAFHGHTHVQEICAWESDAQAQRHLRVIRTPGELIITPGTPAAPNRYLVGVGSAGAPDDGPGLCYALYDDVTQQVILRRL